MENLHVLTHIFENAKNKLPNVDSDTNYWFIRANSGEYFNSFNIGNYIAIGWNDITFSDLETLSADTIKERITEKYEDSKKPGSAYSQMKRFANELKINDIVIVPSASPNNLLVGTVSSEPYTETEENIQSETNICPYNKRIKVRWAGIINNRDIDPSLYKLVYSGQTITNANSYKKFINRGLYDSYIEDDSMSITFKVREDENVSAFAYNQFLSSILLMAEILKNKEDQDITIRTNVQSQGPLELLGDPEIMANIGMIIEWVFKFSALGSLAWGIKKLLKAGGEISINKETGFTAKINGEAGGHKINAEAEKTQAEAYRIRTEADIEKLNAVFEIANSQEFKSAAEKLAIKIPVQITRALESTIDELSEPEGQESSNTDME